MTSRREFIKISSLSAGGLTLGFPLISNISGLMGGEDEYGTSFSGRTPTYCEVCFWKCAGWVYKNEKGDIWKIIGNDEDQHCNGRFCPRGTGGVGMYYDEDRLKKPLIRTESDGRQSFREASWDEALDFIAVKLKKIAEEHGPECVALFTHGSGGKYFGDLLKAYGSNNITAPSYA